ncbi:hypothetical protein FHS38_006670 [Streptomyces netropsis]|uniref:Uncharacterized protein n=1 Tax=Streptomyces netropsis TaxID=55404 RepID=A0A7W7PJB3_STRNE|nr:hypothetical protein [Streptomyces netropsis]
MDVVRRYEAAVEAAGSVDGGASGRAFRGFAVPETAPEDN